MERENSHWYSTGKKGTCRKLGLKVVAASFHANQGSEVSDVCGPRVDRGDCCSSEGVVASRQGLANGNCCSLMSRAGLTRGGDGCCLVQPKIGRGRRPPMTLAVVIQNLPPIPAKWTTDEGL
ncbi:genome polyprotein [Striga asiatica]|uniref:Genome polyprotein n=1 Tax=Striga asiatica TaxID=4170 RepID=A0A5A7QAY3_STRAF|nr:genome polyprotein [Striga asiatica]GER42677.1 genome polyprotein [Striga asiatica]